MSALTLLHTSDWHLGHQLYGRRREDEFAAFLQWLAGVIGQYGVDVLVIAGDVFDTAVPNATALAQYFNFLQNAANAGARHIVITAGNHDSPHYLTSPQAVLRQMRIHLVGSVSENLHDEVLVLKDAAGEPELIVCAVPYIREKDARESAAGESIADMERNLEIGIRNHYRHVAELARQIRDQLGVYIPIIATGHLFTSGAVAGDGVRELYIGNLGHVPTDIFPDIFDYVALGHIHKPQKVGGRETCRYSGSPLPMSFAEASVPKQVLLVRFTEGKPEVEAIQPPKFRNLQILKGNSGQIFQGLGELREQGGEVWVEIQPEAGVDFGALCRKTDELVKDTRIVVLNIKNPERTGVAMNPETGYNLDDISPEEMFQRLMDQKNYPQDQRDSLTETFSELMAIWHEKQREAGV